MKQHSLIKEWIWILITILDKKHVQNAQKMIVLDNMARLDRDITLKRSLVHTNK